MVKSRKEILLERIQKLEKFVYTESDGPAIRKIIQDHLEYLRKELKVCEEDGNLVYERLEELKKEFTEEEYKLLTDMVDVDIDFGLTLGANYTEKKLLVVVNSVANIVRRLKGETAKEIN